MGYKQLSAAKRNVICLSGVLVFAAIVVLIMDALGVHDEFLVVAPLFIMAAGVAGTVPAIRNPLRRLCGLDPI